MWGGGCMTFTTRWHFLFWMEPNDTETRDMRNSLVRVRNQHMESWALWVEVEINIDTWFMSESIPKSIPILQHILTRNQNQFQYLPHWVPIGDQCNQKYNFLFLYIANQSQWLQSLTFQLIKSENWKESKLFWVSGYTPIWEIRKLYSWFLYALFGSCHGI